MFVFTVELGRETDERWNTEVTELPGALAYGPTWDEAIARVQAIALRMVADRLENDEAGSDLLTITFVVAGEEPVQHSLKAIDELLELRNKIEYAAGELAPSQLEESREERDSELFPY